MTDVSDRIAELSPERRALLERLSRAGGAPAPGAATTVPAAPPAPARRTGTGPAPLSSAQRRLWFLDQMGGSVAYSAPVTYRIRGPLDVGALDRALRSAVDRHAALRTVFPERDGEPVQVVRDVPERMIRLESVQDRPVADREGAAFDLLRAEVATPFDLAAGPVMRVLAVRIADGDHLVVLNIHHITSDQWSMGVLVRELPECYDAAREGREPELAELPVDYADFAVWEQQRLAPEALGAGLDHWAERLEGMTPVEVPTDRPRPRHTGHRGAETARWLAPDVVSAVAGLGGAAGTSPFMTLLGVFVALLARHTGSEDVAVGTTSAGRDVTELEGLVGFFVNTLVLRTGLTGDPSTRDLLARVRSVVLDAHRHGHIPFDQIVERVQPVREPGRPPLIPVMFQQDNTPDCALSLSGLDVALVDDFDPGTAKYDLLVSVRSWESAVRVHVQYDTELYDAETVERLLSGYEAMLSAAAADPDAPVATLDALGPDEERRVLVEWNDTAADTAHDVCLHRAFEQHADARPDSTAVVSGGVGYSFAEVEARANRLARYLIGRGVGPGTPVALYLRPGVDQVTAVYAVLKAGGAFVPLDPEYPAARIAFVLGDAAAPIVLTTAGLAGSLRPPSGSSVVEIDGADRDAIAAHDPSRPDGGAGPDDLCYIIYTSGSTGRPKGVLLRHRGVANNLDDLRRSHDVGPGDAVLGLSSPGFDMSVYEVIGLPTAGGTVVLPEPELARDPAHWVELAADHGVTVWNSAPALLEMFLAELEQTVADPPALRLALLGGDWVPVTMPDRLRALAPDVRVVVLGGATEASIHSIVQPVDRVDPSWRSIPYGRPMANQEAYVLDDRGRPAPIGVPGELHLGGIGLAAGYLNRPGLTEEKFVTWSGRRLYRTGDMARWGADGVLELLGRRDFMVKIKGVRIELGEIESALRSHPDVREAVVVARTADDGERSLVAFVTSSGDPDPVALRDHLSGTLPSGYVPASWVVLDELPLSPNGKVDRAGLTERASGAAPVEPGGTSGEPPRGELEQHVAQAWCSVLERERVGREDDFFALGGDSFKAVRLARAIGRGLPVIAVFRHPTVAGLAAHLAEGGDARGTLLHRLTPDRDAVATHLVCVPYGGGNAVAYQPLADALPDDWALWSVDLPGHDLADPAPLEPIEDVAARCAREVADRVGAPVALYGQCAGTAATLALGRALERIGVEVRATFMGAALPDPDPEQAWQMVQQGTDEQLFGHMRGLGGFDGVLAEDDVAGILRVVRHDLTEMVGMYVRELSAPAERLAGPVHCVVGDADPATEGYAERYLDWARYGAGSTVSVVAGGGHYFCKHQPDEVAAVVTRLLGS